MIHPRIVRTIVRKDMVDGIRETRVLVSLLTPILLAVLYNALFPEAKLTVVKAAYVGPETSAIVQTLVARAEASQSVELQLRHVDTPDAARKLVATKDVEVAFVLPDGVDEAIKAGRAPTITVMQPEIPSSGGPSFVQSAIDIAARTLAGQRPAAVVAPESVDTGATDVAAMTQLGPRKYFVLATIVMMIGMIAVLAVPIMLTEEVEKKTLDAVLLAGSYLDVIAAKALVGLAYTALSVVVMLLLTRLQPQDRLTFVAGTAVMAVTLIGLGLLLGGLFRSAQQVYSWSSVMLLPIILPAFAAGLPGAPDWVDGVLRAMPTSQGMRIVANGLAGRALFPDLWQAFLVLAVWAVALYGLLAFRLSRRES